MTEKERFGRFSGFRVGFLATAVFWAAACQTPTTLGNIQKIFSGSAIDLAGATAQVSAPELPNGGLGWVTVSIPVRAGREVPSSLRVSAQFVEALKAEETVKADSQGKVSAIDLVFFDSDRASVEGKSSPSKLFSAFLPVPYDHPAGRARVIVSLKDQDEIRQIEVPFQVVDGKYSSETLRVNPRRVNPPKGDLPRIAQEVKEVGGVYRNLERTKFWQGPFELPIRSEVTSAYGTRRVYNGALKSFHSGLDLRAPVGTPIYAAAPGKVSLAKELFFTGNTVILDHGYGVMTLYAHMSELKVKAGDVLTAKQLVGLSGQTGRVNGPHLHWQAVIDGVKVNPVGLTQEQVP